jgi:hypothetical protein
LPIAPCIADLVVNELELSQRRDIDRALNLYCKPIGDAGAIGLCKAIEVNETLTELNLGDNQIGDAGAIGLGEGLKVNATLAKLELYFNRIQNASGLPSGLWLSKAGRHAWNLTI